MNLSRPRRLYRAVAERLVTPDNRHSFCRWISDRRPCFHDPGSGRDARLPGLGLVSDLPTIHKLSPVEARIKMHWLRGQHSPKKRARALDATGQSGPEYSMSGRRVGSCAIRGRVKARRASPTLRASESLQNSHLCTRFRRAWNCFAILPTAPRFRVRPLIARSERSRLRGRRSEEGQLHAQILFGLRVSRKSETRQLPTSERRLHGVAKPERKGRARRTRR